MHGQPVERTTGVDSTGVCGTGTGMTRAIQELIKWQAEDPKRREWTIRQWPDDSGITRNKVVRIQLTEENLHVERAVTLVQIQDAKFDVLAKEAGVAMVMLTMGEPPKHEVRHGETCKKNLHRSNSSAYLHGPEDDTLYDVDGATYCGRCHEAL